MAEKTAPQYNSRSSCSVEKSHIFAREGMRERERGKGAGGWGGRWRGERRGGEFYYISIT